MNPGEAQAMNAFQQANALVEPSPKRDGKWFVSVDGVTIGAVWSNPPPFKAKGENGHDLGPFETLERAVDAVLDDR
jgi:hypothetical protein